MIESKAYLINSPITLVPVIRQNRPHNILQHHIHPLLQPPFLLLRNPRPLHSPLTHLLKLIEIIHQVTHKLPILVPDPPNLLIYQLEHLLTIVITRFLNVFVVLAQQERQLLDINAGFEDGGEAARLDEDAAVQFEVLLGEFAEGVLKQLAGVLGLWG